MRLRRLAATVAVVPLLASCDDVQRSTVSFGSPTSIIVMATDQVWEVLGDSLRTSLEPLVFTVTAERAFDVTHVQPGDEQARQYLKFRQLMVIGTPRDSWVEPALDKAGVSAETLPVLAETSNVWALGQHVTVLALDPERPASGGLALLEEVRRGVDMRFRSYVLEKMYVSGVNEELAEALLREEGISLTLPSVYREVPAEDGVRIFKNDLPDPAEIARYVLVKEVGSEAPEATAEAVASWRESVLEHVALGEHGIDQRVQRRGKLGDADPEFAGRRGGRRRHEEGQARGAEHEQAAQMSHGSDPFRGVTGPQSNRHRPPLGGLHAAAGDNAQHDGGGPLPGSVNPGK